MRQNTDKPNIVATGGKENDLKIWDLEKPSEDCVFKAKNVSMRNIRQITRVVKKNIRLYTSLPVVENLAVLSFAGSQWLAAAACSYMGHRCGVHPGVRADSHMHWPPPGNQNLKHHLLTRIKLNHFLWNWPWKWYGDSSTTRSRKTYPKWSSFEVEINYLDPKRLASKW